MKPIEKDELFNHLSGFLKTRGIELTEGSYSNGIQKTCSLMADAINLGQQGFERTKMEFDKRLEQLRQVIHEKTAPKPPQTASPPPTATATQTAASTQASSSSTGNAAKKSHRKKAKHSKSRRR